MSALGHKQTCAAQKVMSALPPIATAKADMPQMVMSALPLKADMCGATFIRVAPTTANEYRFGSLADIRNAASDVRFALKSDRESGLPQTVMSALPPESGCKSRHERVYAYALPTCNH
jgi:hypothetical protein